MTFKYICTLALVIGWLACVGHGQQVNVIPNKYVLTSADTALVLQCVNFGFPYTPYNVVVFTILEQVVYNSSNSAQTNPNVYVVNQTSISYSNITNGVIDIGCNINGTQSQIPLTVPYIAPVVLNHSPAKFNPNTSFWEQCNFSVSPNVTNIVVNFTLNNTLIGQYVNVPFQSPLFQTPAQLTNLSVQQGNTSYSIFATPAPNATVGGLYQCSILVTVPMGQVLVNSNIWNTNGSFALVPSYILLLTIFTLRAFFSRD